jgi:hypothetical protein
MINEYYGKDKIKLKFGKVFQTEGFLNDVERGFRLLQSMIGNRLF